MATDKFNARRSRYRDSKVLRYEEYDPSTERTTFIHYLEGRFPKRRVYRDSIIHVMGVGDELDLLAYYYYGKEGLWWIIADHNLIDDPNRVVEGTVLEIPPLRVTAQYQ